MPATETALLIILTTLLSILLIVTILVMVAAYKLLGIVKTVAAKAETVVESVESAAEVFKDTQGRLAALKLIRNIIKLARKGSK